MQENQTWTIIIFGYNEEENIGKVIEQALSALNIISPVKHEIIIVDDGSTDKTWEVASYYKAKYPNIKTIRHPVNLGIGKALYSGYMNSSMENICAVPADGQFDCNELLPYSEIPENSFISFFRLENKTYSFLRNQLSFYNKFLNMIFLSINLKDINWVKIYKRKKIIKLKLKTRSSLIETEICGKLIIAGNRVIEVESKYLPRESGKSKASSFKIIKLACLDIPKLIFEIFRFKAAQKY